MEYGGVYGLEKSVDRVVTSAAATDCQKRDESRGMPIAGKSYGERGSTARYDVRHTCAR